MPASGIHDAVLDAWPILEWLKGRQPATRNVRNLLDAAFEQRMRLIMTRINYGEVLYSLRKDFPAHRVDSAQKAFHELPIQRVSIDDALVDEAVELKAVHTISYADAFAAALAIRTDLPLVTGDKEFQALQAKGLLLLWVGE